MNLIEKYIGEVKKTKEAKMVLQMMDKDYSYQDALKMVIKKTGINKKKLEKDLDHWI